jgi:hypothetical protein
VTDDACKNPPIYTGIYIYIYSPVSVIRLVKTFPYHSGGSRGHDRMVVGFTTVPITTDVVSSNLNQGEMYNIM